MKRIRFLIPAVLLIIAISLWAIQYNNINRYFNNTYPLALKCYEAGDVVPFEDNVLAGNELNEYIIFQITNLKICLKKCAMLN